MARKLCATREDHKEEKGVLDLRSNKACRLDGRCSAVWREQRGHSLSRMEGRTVPSPLRHCGGDSAARGSGKLFSHVHTYVCTETVRTCAVVLCGEKHYYRTAALQSDRVEQDFTIGPNPASRTTAYIRKVGSDRPVSVSIGSLMFCLV